MIQEICDCLKKENHSLLTFRLLNNDIIHMMINEFHSDDVNFENVYSVFSLSQCLTIKDFHEILCEVCRKLMNSGEYTETKESDMVSEAITYMKENYSSSDLNMSSLADYLKVSGVTLAVKFKNVMGMSPSDYLAIIRMEHAKQLLKETQMQVKEVSMAVGYEDDHVFMRRFKKYAGKTPGQYRADEGLV